MSWRSKCNKSYLRFNLPKKLQSLLKGDRARYSHLLAILSLDLRALSFQETWAMHPSSPAGRCAHVVIELVDP